MSDEIFKMKFADNCFALYDDILLLLERYLHSQNYAAKKTQLGSEKRLYFKLKQFKAVISVMQLWVTLGGAAGDLAGG